MEFPGNQLDFSDYFTGERFRYDFVLAGNFEELRVYPLSQKREPHWAGSKKAWWIPWGTGPIVIGSWMIQPGK